MKNKYNQWMKEHPIDSSWKSEDYENTTVYEAINGDILCVERDVNGNIVDAWEG